MASSLLNILAQRATAPYDVPETLPAGRGIHIMRTAIVMPFITFMFVCMRFYSKLVMKKVKLRLDDYIVGATFILSIAHSVLMVNATYNGMGLHIWQYTPELNSRYYLWIGISSEFYAICLMGFKSALILLYLQLFGTTNRKFRWCCYALLVYTCGYITANMFTEFLGCQPIEKKWNQSTPGHCINSVAANIIYGFGHMSSDLMIGILPLPMIWRMRFKTTKEKLGLSLVLTSGFIAWAIACVRWAIATYNMVSYDRPWWAGLSFLFSILEVHTGIICCCVATSGPLMRLFFKNIKAATTRTAARYGSSSQSTPDGSESRTRHSISVAKLGVRRMSHAALHPVSAIRAHHHHGGSKSDRPSISSPIIDHPASASQGTPPMADVSQMGLAGHRMAPPAPPTFLMPSYGTDTRTSSDSRSDLMLDGGAFFSNAGPMGNIGPHDQHPSHMFWYGGGQNSSGGSSSVGAGGSDNERRDKERKRMSDEENLLRMA